MATDMGKWSETMDATEETQKICDQVKDEVENRTGKKYKVYTAVKYRDLVLCGGTHYLIKVHVGGEDYIHLTVVQVTGTQVPSPPSLRDVEEHKTRHDPLVHVGADYDHLMVVQGAGTQFPTPPSLSGVEQHKTIHDPLVPFTN